MRRIGLPALICTLVLPLAFAAGCGPKTVAEAETKRDVGWLTDHPSGDAIAALGRMADTDLRAVTALESRAGHDINVHIAAWGAVVRGATWGTNLIRASLGDPTRAEMAASALPRKDIRVVPFLAELEAAVVRLAAGKSGGLIAAILASLGPAAHATVERRLVDPKTRSLMCDGIALPEASGDAKSVLLAVPTEARNSPSCVTTVIGMAGSENVVLDWIAIGAEPGLLGVAAKSTLPCPRLAVMWMKALRERGPESQAAMGVPLQRSIGRCATAMDPVLAELLTKAPRARPTIIQAMDPYSPELAGLKETCAALKRGHANGETPLARERVREALTHGCALAR